MRPACDERSPRAQKTHFKKNQGSVANKIFLLKWGMSIKFFKRFYLRTHLFHNEVHDQPNKNLSYYIYLIKDKLSYCYYKIFSKIKL